MQTPRPSFTDSPWFWVYVFCTAALVGLALIGPKYGSRQAQIERQFHGRQAAAMGASSQLPADTSDQHAGDAYSSTGHTLVSLRPLWMGLAVLTTVAWIVFWRVHLVRQGAVTSVL